MDFVNFFVHVFLQRFFSLSSFASDFLTCLIFWVWGVAGARNCDCVLVRVCTDLVINLLDSVGMPIFGVVKRIRNACDKHVLFFLLLQNFKHYWPVFDLFCKNRETNNIKFILWHIDFLITLTIVMRWRLWGLHIFWVKMVQPIYWNLQNVLKSPILSKCHTIGFGTLNEIFDWNKDRELIVFL